MRIAVMGAGPWARNYMESIGKIDNFQLTAICPTHLGSSFSPPPVGAQVYLHWEELLDTEIFDGVIVATDPNIQNDIALVLAARNIPMILEKPVALDAVSLMRLEDALVDRGPLALVNHFHLFHPAFRRFTKVLAKEDILKIEIVDGSLGPFRRAISPLYDWAPHSIGIALSLLQSLPTHIKFKRSVRENNGEVWILDMNFGDFTKVLIKCGNGFEKKKRDVSVTVKDRGKPFRFDLSSQFKDHETIDSLGKEMLDMRPPMEVLLAEFHEGVNDQILPCHFSLKIAFEVTKIMNLITTAESLGLSEVLGNECAV